jgi:hypothetical protein
MRQIKNQKDFINACISSLLLLALRLIIPMPWYIILLPFYGWFAVRGVFLAILFIVGVVIYLFQGVVIIFVVISGIFLALYRHIKEIKS